MRPYQFYTYILTNWNKTVLYTGFTNNLAERLVEHFIGKEGAFTTNYKVHFLIWYEETKYVLNAIDREKKIKRWTRPQKEELIAEMNPEWTFYNEAILGNWPPTIAQMNAVREKWQREEEAKKQKINEAKQNILGNKGPLRG